MIPATTLSTDREQHLNAILLPFLQALEKGQAPDRQQFLAAHPEFADELSEFFAARDCLQRFTTRQPDDTPPPDPAAERKTLGDFRLIRQVGRGGMGVVYEARQSTLNRRVALKVLPFAAALDARQLQRFKNEAQAAALLHHPHIVPIYAVGCEQGVHYYAMQFIEGRSLAAMIHGLRQPPGARPDKETRRQGDRETESHGTRSVSPCLPVSLSPCLQKPAAAPARRSAWRAQYFRRVADLGMKAAEALDHAHQLGVVHRDIKPANLLLDRQGHLWITDFGVALLQNTGGLTATGEMVGTLRYMSPEQAGVQRGVVDHRTDIYSLGATLYELLTLAPPFPSNDPHQLLQQITTEEPRPLRSLDRAIPAELEVIVLKALAKNPAERYATAGELADDLRRFLEDRPIRARRPALWDRTLKWARRHRAAVGSALVLLVLATLGLLVSTVRIAQAHGEAKAAYQRERQKADEAREQRALAEANLAQARQVVDFLTQISAEELGDRPELLHVRQKMLEAALQYYQQFIAQHQGDASIRAELDRSHVRATQILGALSAQREYLQRMLRVMLLEERDVQKDLGISRSQEEQIGQLSEGLTNQRREAFRKSFAQTEPERARKFKEMAATNENAVAAILTSDQARRLKQIALQLSPQAFTETEVVETLRLTPGQTARIRPLVEESLRKQYSVFRSSMHPAEYDQKTRQIAQETEQRVLALLTGPQQAAWKSLTGERFRGRLHFAPPTGFGSADPGPRGPRPPMPPPDSDDFPPGGKPPPPDGPKGPGQCPGKGRGEGPHP